MAQPYIPVPHFIHERFTIAIMCNESMNLHWQDEQSGMSYMGNVFPQDLLEEKGADYVLVKNQDGKMVKIRLDLIRNMPTPVK
ncbi:hypothetical protein [Sulfurirhabdus autotrophica]|uniref:Uncharacterized protein n=1 Tax=Sulfurirhabdus autotrophica TaxID=1706046 RepID=A0A4R3Y3J5_9PROT|nr:hypothetical protein [Sulfurirhabdus autotrophica]TCV84683.1 hypothetical protein EDC63_11127 [Sulfurirhabdus autotrophica]